jgi:carbamate kinase
MRIVIALGGNALLQRSDPMTTEVQRRNIAAGSMGPKVKAAIRFTSKTGRRTAIGSLDDIAAIVAGKAGTNVIGPGGG